MLQQRWSYLSENEVAIQRMHLLLASTENSTMLYESLSNTHMELERRATGMENITAAMWALSLIKHVTVEVMVIQRIQYKKHYELNVSVLNRYMCNYCIVILLLLFF